MVGGSCAKWCLRLGTAPVAGAGCGLDQAPAYQPKAAANANEREAKKREGTEGDTGVGKVRKLEK